MCISPIASGVLWIYYIQWIFVNISKLNSNHHELVKSPNGTWHIYNIHWICYLFYWMLIKTLRPNSCSNEDLRWRIFVQNLKTIFTTSHVLSHLYLLRFLYKDWCINFSIICIFVQKGIWQKLHHVAFYSRQNFTRRNQLWNPWPKKTQHYKFV